MCKLLIAGGVLVVVIASGSVALRRADIPYATLEARYANAHSRYVDLPGGVRMHYRDQGPRTAPTLVLLHGFSASLHTWEFWVERLGDRYRLVTIDLPGHGLTRAPAGHRASIPQYVREVEAFATARALPHFTIVGNSMGGNVAWEYALAHPERVEGLVLVAASGWPDARANPENAPLIFRLMRNPIARALLRDLDNTTLVRRGLDAAFPEPGVVDDAMVRRYVDLCRAPGHRELLLQMSDVGDRRPATSERLRTIHAPTLVLQGDRDNLVSPDNARRFAAAIPGAELVRWADGGHIPQEERPDRSADAIGRFLARVYAREGVPVAANPGLR